MKLYLENGVIRKRYGKKIKTTDRVPSGYELFMYVTDNFGAIHKFCASPIHGGVINFFDSLSELKKWYDDVEDIRRIQEGKLSRIERVMENVYTGDMIWNIAKKIINIST